MHKTRDLAKLLLILLLSSSCQTELENWNKRIEKANNQELTNILDSIYHKDQYYRQQLAVTIANYGDSSSELQNLHDIMQYTDSSNLEVISIILDKKGWLGTNEVGPFGSACLFLVVQHADLEAQLRYLPMMRNAVKNSKAQSSQLALLEDRVALRLGKKQIYGSQVGRHPKTGLHYILPLENPDSVDIRRSQMGLGKLENYVEYYGIKWDANEYKKQLSLMERELF